MVAPGANVTLALPGSLRWKARKVGETYRVFIYASGKLDKAVLDSGSLGTGTELALPDGGLPAGKYEAVVQVRDVVAGYGQSQSHFRFPIGSPAGAGVSPAPGGPEPAAPAKSPAAAGDTAGGQAPAQAPAGASGSQPEGLPAAKPNLK